ncbi:MAG: HlyC/CorC family transporter [Bdellovibrio sp.]|nr:HlyC/CorC family transporter [Bdellovibrio sp.]
MVQPLEIIELLVCFLFSAFFSGAEAVLLSIGIDRARLIIEQGGRFGRAVEFMTEHATELLTTILVGNNIANVFAASLTTSISTRIFGNEMVGVTAGATTLAILIFGEITPKTFARVHAERLAYPVLLILRVIYAILYPVIKLMVWVIHTMLGENAQLRGHIVTKVDVEYMLTRAEKEKTIDSKQIELLTSIMDFPAIRVKDIMVPRSKVKFITNKMNYEEILNYIQIDHYSRYPVCAGDLEHTIGLLHVKDLSLVTQEQRKDFKIEKHLRASFFVYEHMKINAVFDLMNKRKIHLALVKDETGIIVGVISMEDIVEQIVGDISDEHDEEIHPIPSMQPVAEGILVPGTLSLRDLYTDYEIKLPLNDTYSTLAGFILDMLGNNFPKEGQLIVWDGLSFELVKVENQEIKDVRIKSVDDSKHIFSKREAVEAQQESDIVRSDDIGGIGLQDK